MTFVETADNPSPEDGLVKWVDGKDGAALRTGLWKAAGTARGTMFILPGKAEYIEKYFEVIGELINRGFNVVAVDWRGQGLSTREIDHPIKAYIGRFEDFLDDFEVIFAATQETMPGPYYTLAHSMGGNIALRLAGEGRIPFAAMVVTAPMTGLKMPAFWEKTAEVVAQTAVGFGSGERFIPGAASYDPLLENFEDNTVTSDAGRHARTAAIVKALPQIAQGGATYGWMHEAFKSMRVITEPSFGRNIRMPVLLIGAGKDKLVDALSNRYVGVNIPGSEFHMMESSMHEMLMERDEIRAEFWAYFDVFMERAPGQNT